MRRLMLMLLFIAALPAIALPQGTSTWRADMPCGKECRAQGNRPEEAWLVLVVKGKLVCGSIDQDYGLATANRSPSGNFAGKLVQAVAVVGYTDSFADPALFGTAAIFPKDGGLRWATAIPTPIGYLAPDQLRFRRGSAQRSGQEDPTAEVRTACERYFQDQSSNPARTYLESQ